MEKPEVDSDITRTSSSSSSSSRSSSISMLTCCWCKRTPLSGAWLLPCLHCACRPCLDQAATKYQQRGGHRISCPECNYVADVKAVAINDLANRQIHQQKDGTSAAVCDVCKENGVVNEPATTWCQPCARALCAECVLSHDGYYKKHTTEPLEQSNQHRLSSTFRCSRHGMTCEFVCLTCQSSKCVDCWSDCSAGRHDVRRLTGSSVAALVEKAKQNLSRLERGLRSRAQVLEKRQSLLCQLRAARDEQLNALKNRRQKIVDAVDGAHAAAVKALKDAYDELETKAAEMERDAASLDLQVRHAIAYCRFVAGTDASVSHLMLDQHRNVSSRVESLLADVNARTHPLSATELVLCDSSLPDDLQEIAATWIGVPLLNTDDLCRVKGVLPGRSAATTESHSAAGRSLAIQQRAAVEERSPPQTFEQRLQQILLVADGLRPTSLPAVERLLPLHFDAFTSSFQAPVRCCLDIALTQDGYVLLAARDEGMREYSLRGVELRCWLPPLLGVVGSRSRCCGPNDATDEVRTVEALKDGRAAVGVYHSRLIVLLTRSPAGDEWLEERRIAVLESSPNHMSASGDLAAVAGCSGCCGCGSGEERLEVVLLSGKQLLYGRKAEYSLLSVAVTSSLVVTTSDGVVELADGRRACVVDGYDHRNGQRLWRYVASDTEEVYDVCVGEAVSGCTAAAPGPPLLLYLAVRQWDGNGESRVAAIRAADGKQMKEDVLGSESERCEAVPRRLFRLALTKFEPRTVLLATLNWVNKTVTVHSAARRHARTRLNK